MSNVYRDEEARKISASRSADICERISDGSIGWAIRRIEQVRGRSVTLNDGVTFDSPCLSDAREGDIWAVKHEPGGFCFGRIESAVCLSQNAAGLAPAAKNQTGLEDK